MVEGEENITLSVLQDESYSVIFLFYLFLGSCNGLSDMERKQVLEEKVLKIHDETRSKMDAAYQLRMNLQKAKSKINSKIY
ncbi:hypothetical protein AHMF7605_06090 [Adhaeribacter arboris]|uniref:Uncharacterized protein n=1 Tax=Adhaeribacter arboris TaxID=2072846 RepID=A0A2T2YCG0_9BACT|nr:hypothetical protein [Adhaeribacter arboris]PSR53128.1 hypothetical protein AHMF7605_06090 [Adhaeribacter arboris]